MHPDRVTQTSTLMLTMIVLTHKCKFLTAECSRHNVIATYVSCNIQDKSYFFVQSCHHKLSCPQLNVFTLRKKYNNVIFSRRLDRFGCTSLFSINFSKAFFFFSSSVFSERECYLLLRGFSHNGHYHSTL